MLLSFLFATVIAAPSPEVQYKQPQVAIDKRITAITFGSGNVIYVATSSDRGRTFGTPVKVAEPGFIMLGRHRGPRIALTRNAIVVTAIAGEKRRSADGGHSSQHSPGHHPRTAGAKGGGAEGDVMAWRSTDGGATWSEGVRVNDVTGSAREGLHAMAAREQTIVAAWLDLRSKGTKIFGSVSKDGGATWSKNVLVYESPDGSVCECCHPTATIDAEGRIYVMFRNSLAGSRDLYVARSTDGGKSFSPASKLGSGTWQLNACPMDGGGLAVKADGRPVTVWRRGKEIFTASDDRSEEGLGLGKDPSVAITRKGIYTAWTGEGGLLLRTPGRNEPAVLDEKGVFVQLAAAPEGEVVAAWERNGAVVVRLLD
jgi:hypothetical protein